MPRPQRGAGTLCSPAPSQRGSPLQVWSLDTSRFQAASMSKRAHRALQRTHPRTGMSSGLASSSGAASERVKPSLGSLTHPSSTVSTALLLCPPRYPLSTSFPSHPPPSFFTTPYCPRSSPVIAPVLLLLP